MSEGQVEKQVTDDEESVDELGDRAERVINHSRDLEQLREKKRERLLESNESPDDTSRDGSDLLTGWIRDAERYGDTYAVTVEVLDGNESEMVEFDLSWPSNWESATVENEVVSLAHVVGDSDGLDDILEQEVPVIRTEDGEYQLATPRTATAIGRFHQWCLNRSVKYGALIDEGSEIRLNSKLYYSGIVGLSTLPLAIGIMTLSGIVNSFPNLIKGVISTLGGLAVITFGIVFFSALLAGPDPHHTRNEEDITPVVIGFIMAVLTAISLFTAPNLSAAMGGNGIELVILISNIMGGAVLSVLGLAGIGHGSIPALKSSGRWTVTRLTELRDWIRSKRGIDHLR